ncbi:MAG TPA: ATP-dependent helicase, partial [Saprospiraceae bacterium]|nr:ATP-dependent helicase [Saprospiraceae bacterium]
MNTTLKSTPDFDKAYAGLNPEQKAAVDALEGPMMVIAGPGTGKTQILAIRIGNMLLRSDTDPKNILCLTYTEAGASAMRQRLIQFIGPTAYEITICTFHAFCNSVIRENPDAFQQYSDYDVISDLEKNQLLLGILEKQTRESPLYRYHGRYNNDLYNLFKLFSKIKKENWDADRMLGDIDRHLDNLRSDPEYIYKRNGKNYAKGDFKQAAYDTEAKRFQRSKSAIRLYQSYQDGLDAMERYEYEDMIRWVIEKFEVDEFLLAKYQEKYQYVLVDEYQDTNGAQNKLLMQLLSYFESANIFAVGDDDQAIYRFQGANVQNMTDFDRQFHPQKIVLVRNYRSSQIILDAADSVIQHNQERLVHKDPQLSKKLQASGNHRDFALRPVFTENHDHKTEILDVCQQVRSLLHQGVAANEIAVLFRKNKEAEPFIKWFEANEIPYQTSRQINVLDDLLLQHLLLILRFLSKEYQDAFNQDGLLFKILHAPFIPLQSTDISRLSWYLSKKKSSLENRDDIPPECSLLHLLGREDELNAAGIIERTACLALYQKLNAFQKSILDHTPQGLFEKLLTEFNVLDFILASRDKIQYLQVLNSFFEFLKNESQKQPLMTLMEFVDLVEAYRNNSIPLPNTQFVGTKKGVVLSTIHGSKGLEYDYVFMIHATQQNWSQQERNLFKLPPEYVLEDVNTEEDSRRLFYVGLTRARKGIYVSYPRVGEKRENTVSRFVSEMQNSGLVDYRKHLTEELDLVNQLLI